uniref:Small ribosomal subunit protein uS15c n=1 Tax=Kalanchoe fedtschenkoi TaxID=63787 RepID=A0A7N0ZZ94_KALFE
MALQLRHRHKLIISNPKPYFAHFLSTSSTPDAPSADPPPDSQPKSPIGSIFSDIKASLKHQPPPPLPRRPKPKISFTPDDRGPRPKIEFDEIRRNLAEYRRRSDETGAAPSSAQPISFQELFNRNAMSRPGDGSQGGSRVSFDSIRESLKNMRNDSASGRRDVPPMSLSALRNSLSSRNEGPATVVGSGFNFASALFSKEVKEKEDGEKSVEKKAELMRSYSHVELGEKLKGFRPERKVAGENWFSLSELNERLVKLRELEEKQSMERTAMGKQRSLDDLRDSLLKLKNVNEEISQEKMDQRLSILNQIGPNTVQGPPKEELVGKYFHPDNMSAAEKLKLELAAVRDEFKMSESDCGSARVQVAQLTTKIKYLSDSLHKKDKHSRKGLQAMVQLRKKLLKYLRRTDWDSYTMVLSKLGLRDNTDLKNL